MSSISKINWKEREQARKQSAIDEARRRAVEVSEISFPSLGGSGAGAGAGWGIAEPAKPSVASQKWSDIPAVLDDYDETPTTRTTATKPSYAPPVLISRAMIAESIRRSTTTRDDRHYEEPCSAEADADSDGGWQEVRKKALPKPKAVSNRCDYEADFEDNDFEDNDFEDEDDGFASRNS